MVEAAFDNTDEMHAWIDEGATAQAREAAGCREPVEHYTAVCLRPGDNARARRERLDLRRVRRGLAP